MLKPVKARKPQRSPRIATRNQRPLPSVAAASADAQRIAVLAAQAGLEKKAAGIEIIDVTGKVDYADYLVLMTGHNERHVATIAQAVDELLSKEGIRAISIEGTTAAEWVLIDFVDVVVHVFREETRSLYDLGGLWMDARRLPVPDSSGAV
jgi:ribosome-associated protein